MVNQNYNSAAATSAAAKALPVMLLAFLAAAALVFPSAFAVGVNFGETADDLPTAAVVLQLVQTTPIKKIKLYEADPAILTTFAGTGIDILIGAGNEQIQPLAAGPSYALQWVQTNIAAYPNTSIVGVALGNEVLSYSLELIPFLLPALQNLQAALVTAGLDQKVKLSTPHSLGIVAQSFPPSYGEFHYLHGQVLGPLLDFFTQTGAPFMVNAYPYFAYAADPNISLDYVLFNPTAVPVYDNGSGLSYTNMFDAQVDAVYAAISKLGYNNVSISVTETGWPSAGDPTEVGANIANAQLYNANLIKHVDSGVGTPAKPNVIVDTYIFALYNEDLKPGPASERNFGLFLPDGTPMYSLTGAWYSSPPPPVAESPYGYVYPPPPPVAVAPSIVTLPPPPFTGSPDGYDYPPPPPVSEVSPPPPYGYVYPPPPVVISPVPEVSPPPPYGYVYPPPPVAVSPVAEVYPPPPPVAASPYGYIYPPPPPVAASPYGYIYPPPPPVAASPYGYIYPPPPPVAASPDGYIYPPPPPVAASPDGYIYPPPPPLLAVPPAAEVYPPPPPTALSPYGYIYPPPPDPPIAMTPDSYPPPPLLLLSPPPPLLAVPPLSAFSPPPPPPVVALGPGAVDPPPPPPVGALSPGAVSPPPPPLPLSPGSPPAAPGPVTGPSWCVAQAGADPGQLQIALNWACSDGGANCSPIQPGAACYTPNSIEAHASYAFDSYYQINNRQSWDCFFSDTAVVTTVDPSFTGCTYP